MTEQKQFLDVIDLELARQRFHAALELHPLGSEVIPLRDALGRTLASNVRSAVNVPSFDRSDFDGFAIRANDTHGSTEDRPRELALIDKPIRTAMMPDTEIDSGFAVPIATGAMLPRGADAVLMIEDADRQSDRLLVRRGITAGFGVSFAGTDISSGELVLVRGRTLTSRETGVLAAIGCTNVEVFRRPRVAILSTGDEIIAPGQTMRPSLVYDSNARILADSVREIGGEPIELGIAIDDLAELDRLIAEGLESADAIVLSGGTSKGEGDLSYQVVKRFDDPGIVVHGVALKPGKPVCLAATRGIPVVILPGFPTSAIFTFHEFVAPILRVLGGMAPSSHSTVDAELSIKIQSAVGRTEYALVGLVHRAIADSQSSADHGGDWLAFPMGKGSGSVTTFSQADGFITVDRQRETIDSGERVRVELLGKDIQPADLVVIGSHCIGLDHLLARLQQSGINVKFMAVGSLGGLEALKRGQCDMAGMHLLDPDTETFNRPFVDSDMQLVPGYQRRQGFVFRRDDSRFAGRTSDEIADLVRHAGDVVMMNRNVGSGTRIIIDMLLGDHRPDGYALQSKNHHAVAAAVAQGRADWGVAIELAVDQENLGFVALRNEQFDFAVRCDRMHREPVKAFCELLQSESGRSELRRLGLRFENDA